jgi:hypothetical protein
VEVPKLFQGTYPHTLYPKLMPRDGLMITLCYQCTYTAAEQLQAQRVVNRQVLDKNKQRGCKLPWK